MTSQEPVSIPRPHAALAGLLAAGAALGVGDLVAGWVAPRSSPLLAVGNGAIDMTPGFVKDFAIQVFGTNDKLALLVGMFVVIALLAVGGGLLSRRQAWPGVAMVTVFGLVGVIAVLSRPDLSTVAVISPLVALLTGIGVFVWLHRLAAGNRSAESGGMRDDRRRFLASSGAVAAGVGLATIGGRMLVQASVAETSRRAISSSIPPVTIAPLPPKPDFFASGSPRFITPNSEFYRIDTALTVPQLRAEEWQLRIHGMVDKELVLSFADLLRRRLVARPVTLTCVSNEVGGPLVSTSNFTGVPIRDLLLEAGIRPGAQQVFSTSSDGYTAGTPLDVLMEPDRGALLAIGMNGEPLPAEHGFPARMVVPGLYGYVSATKWIVDAEITTFDRAHYWEMRGWAKEAPIKTHSRIDRPQADSTVDAGRVTLAGIAWAQHTGVDRVQVRVDGGRWRTAELANEVSRDTWRMWRVAVELSPGAHTVECRATDRSGYTQTRQDRPVVPDGATGWHSVSVTAQ